MNIRVTGLPGVPKQLTEKPKISFSSRDTGSSGGIANPH